MWLWSAGESTAGMVALKFNSPEQYHLRYCRRHSNFPTDLPSETDKVWTISLFRTSSEIRVVINCNNKEVLNVVLSDTVCTNFDRWNTYWSRDVEQIAFEDYVKASDYYRPGKHQTTIDQVSIRLL